MSERFVGGIKPPRVYPGQELPCKQSPDAGDDFSLFRVTAVGDNGVLEGLHRRASGTSVSECYKSEVRFYTDPVWTNPDRRRSIDMRPDDTAAWYPDPVTTRLDNLEAKLAELAEQLELLQDSPRRGKKAKDGEA